MDSEEIKEIREDIKRIMENHLPHIREQIVSLEVRTKSIIWVSSVIVGLVITNIIQLFFKGK